MGFPSSRGSLFSKKACHMPRVYIVGIKQTQYPQSKPYSHKVNLTEKPARQNASKTKKDRLGKAPKAVQSKPQCLGMP